MITSLISENYHNTNHIAQMLLNMKLMARFSKANYKKLTASLNMPQNTEKNLSKYK